MKCRFISTDGSNILFPPPIAPPFLPNTGPRDGSLRQAIALNPNLFNESFIPMLSVVLPSPDGVGLIEVTNSNLPFFD